MTSHSPVSFGEAVADPKLHREDLRIARCWRLAPLGGAWSSQFSHTIEISSAPRPPPLRRSGDITVEPPGWGDRVLLRVWRSEGGPGELRARRSPLRPPQAH